MLPGGVDGQKIIGCTGTKGQFSELLQKPAILFDDKQQNLELMPSYCAGVLVPRSLNRRIRSVYPIAYSPYDWAWYSEQFKQMIADGNWQWR